MRTIFLTLLSIITIFCVHAQTTTYTITGQLTDDATNLPLDYADIELSRHGNASPVIRIVPDTTGHFVIENITAGKYSLSVRLTGYDFYSIPDLEIGTGNSLISDLGTIRLKPLELGLSEVVVVAQKRQIVYKLDKRIIDAASNIMASGGSAASILENTPSIRIDADGEVTFRGSTGFKVYVDGKPSPFSGTQALDAVPANQIDNIEIITTPTARYDADGDVGIINIITKRNSFGNGLNGIVNLSGSTVLSRQADMLLSFKKGASQWTLGAVFNEQMRKSHFEQEKTTAVDGINTVSNSDGPRQSKNFTYTITAGWLYDLHKHTTFNIELEWGKRWRKFYGNLDYSELQATGSGTITQGDYHSYDEKMLDEPYVQMSGGITHKFDNHGHQLSATFLIKHHYDALEYMQSDLYNLQGIKTVGKRSWESEYHWTTKFNLDYRLPFAEAAHFDSGFQFSSYVEDGDYTLEQWDYDRQEYAERNDIYNQFRYLDGLSALYVMAGSPLGNFDVQVGLRGEYYHRSLNITIPDKSRDINTFDLFPSAHIGYDMPDQGKLIASYSRRISRANIWYMEPYITFRDYCTAEVGNPDIGAEYINSYELTYKKTIRQFSLSASLFHRSRRDKIERLRVPYEPGITLDSMANVGNDYSTGLELVAQTNPVKWWDINLNGNIYHYKVKNHINSGGETRESVNYDIMWNNTFSVARNTRIQLDGNFVGPSVTTQGRTRAFWYANLAIRQLLFDRRLIASLTFRDVFNSARYVNTISTAQLRSVTHIRPSYPLITLSLSYTFNSFKRKTTAHKEDHDLFEGTNH